MALIQAKAGEELIERRDADSLRADLVCRVKRNVLNHIQADEGTPWETIKARLKKAYGGGRWTP
ncbi:hypothetical protein ACUWC2_28410, partial [Klebsiella pneumoniae]|uniref:hypothetical protein n=1 Tax=Klebsiella pneumoniae TaxID=573 RepID=UPI0040556D65